MEKWVGVREVSEHIGQKPDWTRKYAPLIPHVRIGQQYRFRLSEVDKWLEQWRGGDEVK